MGEKLWPCGDKTKEVIRTPSLDDVLCPVWLKRFIEAPQIDPETVENVKRKVDEKFSSEPLPWTVFCVLYGCRSFVPETVEGTKLR